MKAKDRIDVVKLRFDWGMGPFWATIDDDAIPDGYGIDEIIEFLPLGDELVVAIGEWNNRMQSTFDGNNPENLGFNDPADEKKWIDDGRELARRLKVELGPNVRVEYAPLVGPKEVIDG